MFNERDTANYNKGLNLFLNFLIFFFFSKTVLQARRKQKRTRKWFLKKCIKKLKSKYPRVSKKIYITEIGFREDHIDILSCSFSSNQELRPVPFSCNFIHYNSIVLPVFFTFASSGLQTQSIQHLSRQLSILSYQASLGLL